ncbi:MAG: 50S ribosomal protein L5 [Planctomycetota bacterium]|jgi:large subunit ribosomal protein L5
MARLLEKYKSEVLPQMAEKLGRKNPMALPKIEKVCLNMGMGRALQDSKLLDAAVENMTRIAGQKAVVVKAKKSVSNFKVREGWNIACRVTLRGVQMWEFLDRMINAAMPRIRDFRGISPKAFDQSGNYTLGLEEVIIFPEVDPDNVEAHGGMDITIVIRNSEGADESREMLSMMGMPFAER